MTQAKTGLAMYKALSVQAEERGTKPQAHLRAKTRDLNARSDGAAARIKKMAGEACQIGPCLEI